MTGKGKGKAPRTRSMQTRSTATSTTSDDNAVSTSTHHANVASAENNDNVSQTMTDPDPGSSPTLTFKARRYSQSEIGVPEATTSSSRASPPSSIADSSISSTSSRYTTRSGNLVNNGVVSWILENYEVRANSNVPRSGIYEHYKHYCTLQQVKPVNAATFGKLIRVAFPHMSTRRLGNRGQSKYQYCNIQRREVPVNATHTLVDTGGATADVSQVMPIPYSSRQHYQHHYYQAPIIPAESSTSLTNLNVEIVQRTSLFPNQVTESPSLSSQQQQQQVKSNISSNDSKTTIDTRTQPDFHGYLPLQLPSPFGLLPPSSSPLLLPQHHLSNLELVSIFSSQPTTSRYQDMNVSTLPQSLATSSSSSAAPLLADPELLDGTSVPRRLSDSSLIDQFAKLYNQHCRDIYNTVCAGEFEKLQRIYETFYLQMPSHYKSLVATAPELAKSIWRWDCNLYDSFITDLMPKINTPLSKNMLVGLSKYTKNLPGYLQYLLTDYPTKLRNKKSDVASVFVAKMRRHLTLNQFAMKAGDILNQPIRLVEMKNAWQELDMGTILDHVLWICDCRNDEMRKILEVDIGHLLNSKSNLDQWMDWVERLVEKFVPRYPRIHDIQDDENYTKDAKQFVLKWKMYTSSVMQQFYLQKVPSTELFKTLQFFFDDLVLYRVEERIALVHANAIQRPGPSAPILV